MAHTCETQRKLHQLVRLLEAKMRMLSEHVPERYEIQRTIWKIEDELQRMTHQKTYEDETLRAYLEGSR